MPYVSLFPQALLNRHVVIDFGHELMNGIYYPLRVQSGPMSDQEFVDRLEVSFLPAFKVNGVSHHSRLIATWSCNLPQSLIIISHYAHHYNRTMRPRFTLFILVIIPQIHRHIQDLKSYIRMITINVEGLWHPVLDGDMPVGESVQFDESDLCFILGCLSDRLQVCIKVWEPY